MKPEIFVSYSREDQAQVLSIVEKLRERGLNIWIDQEGIHGAKLWSQEIVNAIESSKVFILFASAKAFSSRNVTKELALASESDKHILPIFIEDAEIPAAMKYQLAGIQHLAHEKGQSAQTTDNILSTLGNLDIQFSKSKSTASKSKIIARKTDSKALQLAAALIISLALIVFLLLSGKRKEETSSKHYAASTYKSKIDLCVITEVENVAAGEVTKENRLLRDELIAKLMRFSEYKITSGKALSPDSTTLDFLEVSKSNNSDYILKIKYRSDNNNVIGQLYEGKDGSSFWSRTILSENNETFENFTDTATGIIAANVAGYDGEINRKILQKALVKKEEDLTPIELLQIAKAAWEDMTKDNILKAIKLLERCVSLNPEMSTAYAVLCEIYIECLRRDFDGINDTLSKAKTASAKSLQLDPKNAMALIEKFWLLWYEKDYSSCELHIKLALEANPYEPFVLISAGSFKLVRDTDVEYGLELCDLANKYNEKPQGWYNWPLIIYYSRIGNYKKSLEHSIAGNFKDDNHTAQTSILYWLSGEKESALKRYGEVKKLNNKYTVKDYKRFFIDIYDNKGIENHLDVLKEIESAFEKQ